MWECLILNRFSTGRGCERSSYPQIECSVLWNQLQTPCPCPLVNTWKNKTTRVKNTSALSAITQQNCRVPHVLLLVRRRADVQNLTLLLECWTGISSHENAGVSLVVTLGALWLAVSLGVSASKRGGNQFLKEKKGEKINFITFTKQHKRNNSIFEGSNNSGSS